MEKSGPLQGTGILSCPRRWHSRRARSHEEMRRSHAQHCTTGRPPEKGFLPSQHAFQYLAVYARNCTERSRNGKAPASNRDPEWLDHFTVGHHWENEKISSTTQQHQIILIFFLGIDFLMEIIPSCVTWTKRVTFPLASENLTQLHWMIPNHGHGLRPHNFRCSLELRS